LHRLLLSIDPVDSTAAFWVVLFRVAVLVLLSPAGAWFHVQVCVLYSMSENCVFNWVIL
jgi:hypothetical protein